MKKFIKIVAFIFALLFIGYGGYKYFNKTSVLLGVIHKDADSVLKIGLHNIKETLVLDALTSPKFYYDNASFSSKKKEKDSTLEKGIDVSPYAAVFYTLKKIKSVVFTTLPIKNTTDFNIYIQQYVSKKNVVVEKSKGHNFKYAVLEKGKIVIAWNSKKIAIAVSPNKISLTNVTTVFTDVLVNNKVITQKNNPIIKKLSNNTDHIIYINKKNKVSLNFKDGEAIINGSLITKNKNYFAKEVSVNTMSNASLQLYVDYNFKSEQHKIAFVKAIKEVSFFRKNNLDVAAIVDKSNGFVSLLIDGKTKQTDTIITYTYNDNFEKVEEKSSQEKEVPKIYLNVGLEKEGLKTYLGKQGAISNQNIFTALPYYTFYVNEKGNTTTFSTHKETLTTSNWVSANFFECTVDFNKLKNDVSFPKSDLIFNLLNSFRLYANVVKDDKIGLEGALIAKRGDVNIISQIFFGLENAK